MNLKPMRRISLFAGASLTLLYATLAVPSTGCAQALGVESDPIVTGYKCEGTLHVRIASDFSGTATDVGIPHFFGIYDYLRKQNAQGGIRGCMIDIKVADNRYDPTTTEQVINSGGRRTRTGRR
jgi:ABC-type branched-subunit amino acid transport system substrate-binding protein